MFQPIIKWTGSKRSQSEEIVAKFPKKIGVYYEPFIGGGSVLHQLLNSDIEVEKIICSDINNDLINLWNEIIINTNSFLNEYEKLWKELNKDDDFKRRERFYYNIRNEFNKTHNVNYFNFLTRTCINGMIRYNLKGEFNSPFHFGRDGIDPKRLSKICYEWLKLINSKNVVFKQQSYTEIEPLENDFVYLDPPYINSKTLYYGNFNFEEFWEKLRSLKCKYIFSLDGYIKDKNYLGNIPNDVYSEHLFIKSGKSSFRRIINSVEMNKNENVYESLFLK